MYGDHPHVSFRLSPVLLAQVHVLAQRHDQTLSQLMRDALALLLANPEPYSDLLNHRVLQRFRPPTAEQAAASQRLIAAAATIDLTGLIAQATPPRL